MTKGINQYWDLPVALYSPKPPFRLHEARSHPANHLRPILPVLDPPSSMTGDAVGRFNGIGGAKSLA